MELLELLPSLAIIKVTRELPVLGRISPNGKPPARLDNLCHLRSVASEDRLRSSRRAAQVIKVYSMPVDCGCHVIPFLLNPFWPRRHEETCQAVKTSVSTKRFQFRRKFFLKLIANFPIHIVWAVPRLVESIEVTPPASCALVLAGAAEPGLRQTIPLMWLRPSEPG